MAVISITGKLILGEEINFLNRDEARYPQLMRLNLDYDLRILCIPPSEDYALERYVITYKQFRQMDTPALSPELGSLAALERFANDNIVDILHDILIEPSDEPAH